MILIDILIGIFATLNYFAWKAGQGYNKADMDFIIGLVITWILIRVFFRIKDGRWK
jgi:hypothetical protein